MRILALTVGLACCAGAVGQDRVEGVALARSWFANLESESRSPHIEVELRGAFVEPGKTDSLLIRAIPNEYESTAYWGKDEDVSPWEFLSFFFGYLEFYRDGILVEIAGKYGDEFSHMTSISGLCFDESRRTLDVIGSTWAGGASFGATRWSLDMSTDSTGISTISSEIDYSLDECCIDYNRCASNSNAEPQSGRDRVNGKLIYWQEWTPCPCLKRAESTLSVAEGLSDLVAKSAAGKQGWWPLEDRHILSAASDSFRIPDNTLHSRLDEISGIIENETGEALKDTWDIRQMKSSRFTIIVVDYWSATSVYDSDQWVFIRDSNDRGWRVLLQGITTSKETAGIVELKRFVDDKTIEVVMCVAFCGDGWGMSGLVRIDLSTLEAQVIAE